MEQAGLKLAGDGIYLGGDRYAAFSLRFLATCL